MTFGEQLNELQSKTIIDYFIYSKNAEFDTAFVYNMGKSEEILGNSLLDFGRNQYVIATKVNPRITGILDEKSINMQLNTSLKRLRLIQLDILYLHFPDPHTALEEILKSCDKLHKSGKFKELGLSNFSAEQVKEVDNICKKNHWIRPTVYQGMYNAISRKVEKNLMDTLSLLNIRFYAYNPLAGGLLTDRYLTNIDSPPSTGRFAVKPNYQKRYWKTNTLNALKILKTICDNFNLTLLEASFRWLKHHSSLDDSKGDGIILGVSSLSQLKQNLEILEYGKLPNQIVVAFDQLWESVKDEAPDYFRYTT